MSDRLEEIVAACLERMETDEGPAALDATCAAHPGLADEIRRRVAALADAGLLAATPTPLPERLGAYRLGERLGGGGMGDVFLAVQETLDRPVALKVIRPEFLHSSDTRRRFRREVEAAARLEHPAIVPVHDVGTDHGIPYFAMTFVKGRTLAQVLESLRGRAPARLRGSDVGADGTWVDTCLRWTATVAQALAHAHERGVLHRDVKPSNVMLADDGRVMLIDFGLAQAEWAPTVTRAGHLLGSLAYMAPEQVQGRPVDRRTDVYSLGVTLYELLTLRAAFGETSDPVQLSARIAEGHVPSPRTLNAAVPRDVATVCLKAMDPDPARRYASAAALARDLGRALAGEPVEARPAGAGRHAWRWARRNPAWVVAAGLLAAGLVVFLLNQRAALRRSEAQRLLAHALAQARDNPGLALLLAIEGAEREPGLLANNALCSALAQLHERWTIRPEVGPVVAAEFAPGGARFTTGGAEGRVQVHDIARRSTTLLGHVPKLAALHYGPGGRIVSVDAAGGLCIWSDERPGPVTELPGRHPYSTIVGDRLLAVDTDHRARLFTLDGRPTGAATPIGAPVIGCNGARGTITLATADGRVVVWRPGGDGAVHVLRFPDAVQSMALSPDGTRLLVGDSRVVASSGRLRLVPMDGGDVIEMPPDAGWGPAAFAPDGTWFVTGFRGRAILWDTATGARRRVLGGPSLGAGSSQATVAPDGRHVLVTASDRVARIYDVAAGVEVCALRGTGTVIAKIRFGPEGRVLTTAADGVARLWTVRPVLPRTRLDLRAPRVDSARVHGATAAVATHAGCHLHDLATGRRRAAFLTDLSVKRGVFGPRGERLVTASHDGDVTVWDVATGTAAVRLRGHATEVWFAEFDRAGRRIVTGSGDRTARIWDAETGAERLRVDVPAAVGTVAFAPDGGSFVVGSVDGVARIYDVAGTLQREFKGHAGLIDRACFSPDGQWVATCSQDTEVRLWDARTGRLLGRLRGHRGEVYSVEFDAAGDRLASASADGTARVWSVADRAEVMTLHVNRAEVVYAGFEAGGKRVLTFDETGEVRWWPLDPLAFARAARPRDLTPRERRQWIEGAGGD